MDSDFPRTSRAARLPSRLAEAFVLAIGLTTALQPQPAAPEKVKAAAAFSPPAAAPGEAAELRLSLEILKGWHIYSPDFEGTGKPTRVTVESGLLEAAGSLQFPSPAVKEDKVLNETLRYHVGKVEFRWRHKIKPEAPAGKHDLRIKLYYQACTDATCDLPRTIELQAPLEVLAQAAAPDPASKLSAGEKPLGGVGEAPAQNPPKKILDLEDLLGKKAPPGGLGGLGKEAAPGSKPIQWSLRVETQPLRRGANGLLKAGYQIAPGWHVYSPDHAATGEKTRIDLDPLLALPAGPLELDPPARRKENALKEIESRLEGSGEIKVPFVLKPAAAPGELELKAAIRYQLCTEKECQPPETAELAVQVKVSGEEPLQGGPPQEDGFWFFILSAIGWGLFTLLMPCTYPMIPITISYFTKQADLRKASAMPMALCYGAGIVADFILIGVLVGPVIMTFAQKWYFNLLLGLLFIIFALSLFGLFEIRLPSSFLGLSARASRQGGYAGVFFLGATLVITSFTCTAPFVGTLLGTGAQAKSIPAIILGMAVFGATMAAPFAALALFPTVLKKLPKTGEWMQTLKVGLGFLELAASFKFFSNVDVVFQWQILPRELFLFIWAAIAFAAAIFLLGMVPLKAEKPASIGPLQLAIALAVLIFGAYCAYGAMGHRMDWIMQAIAPNYSGERGRALPWSFVKDDFEAGLAQARKEGKRALVNWTGVT
ncbi:MAG: hypothetical protein HY717_06295 [Planctomycetes bacterium]|nr:hypothetical protein [Planctomycetota bacterium]